MIRLNKTPALGPLTTLLLLLIGFGAGLSGCSKSRNREPIRPLEAQNDYADEIRLKKLSEDIARSPGAGLPYAKRAELYLTLGQTDSAYADILRALSRDTASNEVGAVAVRVYRRRRQIDSALIMIQRLERRGYQTPGLLTSRGEILLILRRYDESLRALNQALELAPYHAEAYYYKGFVFEERGDTTAALSAYQTAIEQNPEYIDAYNKLAKLSMARKQYPAATQYLSSALRFDPRNALAHFNLGVLYNLRDLEDSARGHFAKAVFFDPNLAIAHYQLGYFAYRDRRYLEAAGHLERSVGLDPALPAGHFYLALSRENQGDLEQAKAHYRRVLDLNQGFGEDARKGLARIDRRTAEQHRADARYDSLDTGD